MKTMFHEHSVKQILKFCLRTLRDIMAILKQILCVYLFGKLESLLTGFLIVIYNIYVSQTTLLYCSPCLH